MNSLKIIMGVLLVLLTLAANTKAEAGSGSHGGGGIVRNGEYLTFGSSKVRLRQSEVEDVPGVEIVKNIILKLDLSSAIKGKLLASVIPSAGRRYYYIDQISDSENVRLITIYKSLIKANPNDKVVIYAVTDTQTNETFLLPNFTKLGSEDEKAYVIFHEAMWSATPEYPWNAPCDGNGNVGCPLATYAQVVRAEKAFGNYLESLKSLGNQDTFPVDLYETIGEVLGSSSAVLVYSAINYDVRKGSLKPEIVDMSKYRDTAEEADYLQTPRSLVGIKMNDIFLNADVNTVKANAIMQQMQHPEMAIYKALVAMSVPNTVLDILGDFFGRGFEVWGNQTLDQTRNIYVQYDLRANSVTGSAFYTDQGTRN